MDENEADFLAFPHVRIIEAAAQALFCAIGGKRVWLPRHHIKGHLFRRGDCGRLLVRRWVALDRHLTNTVALRLLPNRLEVPHAG